MLSFEFTSEIEYKDRYVANHSVIIRGINVELGTEEASQQVAKIFENRFGERFVISVNTFRPSKQPKKLYRKVKYYRKKYEEALESAELNRGETITLGQRLKCDRRKVNKLEYFQEKNSKAQDNWERAKEDYKTKNEGVAFVVFR